MTRREEQNHWQREFLTAVGFHVAVPTLLTFKAITVVGEAYRRAFTAPGEAREQAFVAASLVITELRAIRDEE